jgi:hypothetical protein
MNININFNKFLAALALVIITLGGALAAYGLRYVPIDVGNGMDNPVLVWDRWEREVCQISAIDFYPTYCSKTNPYKR